MSSLSDTMHGILAARVKSPKHPALMTHLVIGYPSLNECVDIASAMTDGGARFIELQLPFSDPIADGPTITYANECALQNGVRTADCLRTAEKIRSRVDVPLIFMSYFNILLNYGTKGKKRGLRTFAQDALSIGVEGLIVPDIAAEDEREGYWDLAEDTGLIPIPLVSPLSDDRRLSLIASRARPEGFVYCVSRTATTGAKADLDPQIASYLSRVRRSLKLPLAVGFGISTPAQVAALGPLAEIAVVGSAGIELIRKTSKKERLRKLKAFVARLSSAK